MLARLIYIVLMIGFVVALCVNFVPRMVSPSGAERWFVIAVPGPERFVLAEKAPTVRRVFGYPFTCYFRDGHEFTSKEGGKLFLPTTEQPSIANRFSIAAFFGDAVVPAFFGVLAFLLRKPATRQSSESFMKYKASCPSCGKRMSRWHIFLEPNIYHRCRDCKARFRATLVGWLAGFVAIAIQLLWLVMYRKHVISPCVALVLVLVTSGLAIWLAPYFIPVQLGRPSDT